MNLNISYNWLKEYVVLKESPQDFAKKISLSGPSVDRTQDMGSGLGGVVVGKILEITKHPNADKLFIGKIDIGNSTIQLVFGTKAEVKVGQQLPVAVAPTVLPTGQEINKTIFRGVNSEGMLCLDSELSLSSEDKITFFDNKVKTGTPLAKAMNLDDAIFDMEVTSNRPDAMCIIGMAREASAIMNAKFLYQAPKPNLKISGEEIKLSVNVKEPKICPRYQAIVLTDVKAGPSPLWMQQRLLASGLRPINNLVDITNYILLEYGQPMHVFDYHKLKDNQIIVRLAKRGEKILALDGKEYELNDDNLIIADSASPVAVGGVMGGELSAASANTKTIVFECANFDPVSVRKTARRLNLHSESSNLYEKGLSPINVEVALLRAIELAQKLAGAKVASKIIDVNNYKYKAKEINLEPQNVTRLLGVEIKAARIKEILGSLGFKVGGSGKKLKVSVPWWRDRDMEGQHDLIEEIARVYGYHNLPSKLMAGAIPITYEKNLFAVQDKIKDILVGLGLTEIYAYSFVSEKIITNSSLNLKDHLQIANPLSADFEYLRTSLVPGILQIISENAGFFPEIKIFELSQVFTKADKNLGEEIPNLTVALSGGDNTEIFLNLKGIMEALFKKLNLSDFTVQLMPAKEFWSDKNIIIKARGKVIGSLGLISNKTLNSFGIKKPVAVLDLDLNNVIAIAKLSPSFEPIAKFPEIDLDLSMEMGEEELYETIKNKILKVDPLIKKVSFLSVYQGEKITANKKALAVRITYSHPDKTLELTEAQAIHNQVVEKLKKEYNIKVR